ncbi:hypothetical protein YPPY34_2148, partial [Yersinia pestis PY-34]
MAGGGG